MSRTVADCSLRLYLLRVKSRLADVAPVQLLRAGSLEVANAHRNMGKNDGLLTRAAHQQEHANCGDDAEVLCPACLQCGSPWPSRRLLPGAWPCRWQLGS